LCQPQSGGSGWDSTVLGIFAMMYKQVPALPRAKSHMVATESATKKMGLRKTLHTFGPAPPAPSRVSEVQGLPPTILWQGSTEGP
jgi:hypothetical protein